MNQSKTYVTHLFMIFRSDNIYAKFLDWKMDKSFFQFDYCLSLNFDYFDISLSIPQIATTPKSELKLTFDFPSSCFFVIVGGKYLNKIGSVLKKVDSITNDIGGTRPLAVFIIRERVNKKMISLHSNACVRSKTYPPTHPPPGGV